MKKFLDGLIAVSNLLVQNAFALEAQRLIADFKAMDEETDRETERAEKWALEHEDLFKDLTVDIIPFIIVISKAPAWSFDTLMNKLLEFLSPTEALTTFGVAMQRGVVKYTNGVITLV
jgi:hypothetical protein